MPSKYLSNAVQDFEGSCRCSD